MSKEEDQEIEKLEITATTLGIDSWSQSTHMPGLEEKIGICASCKSLLATKYEFSDYLLYCRVWESRITKAERVRQCSGYEAKNFLTLPQLFQMAHMIDVTNKKPAGFTNS